MEMTIGQKIKTIRQNNELSQSRIEELTGIKREYLSKIENDELKNPTYNTLKKICKGLGVSLADLENFSAGSSPLTVINRERKRLKNENKKFEKDIKIAEGVLKQNIKDLESLVNQRLLNLDKLTKLDKIS
jgi:transcriptional regulator with XRE-family HTH domain